MLTDKRGSVIGEYLAYRGVDPSRVSVVSKGGTKGNDEASKAKNRRVSIVYQ
jgi:outer membrane protein OmpA-like peptidoglycan-associated protein